MTAPERDPGRAAIEALARELTDEQWSRRFVEYQDAVMNCSRCSASTLALLAYLDEVWAGLTVRPRAALQELARQEDIATMMRRADESWRYLGRKHRDGARRLESIGLAHCDVRVAYGITAQSGGHEATRTAITPLGRACLKRAKEQGHALP